VSVGDELGGVEVGDESSDYRVWEVKEAECGLGSCRFLKLVQY